MRIGIHFGSTRGHEGGIYRALARCSDEELRAVLEAIAQEYRRRRDPYRLYANKQRQLSLLARKDDSA